MTLPATPFPPRNFFAAFTDAHAHLPASAADDAAVRLPAGARVLLNATRPGDFPRVAALAEKFPAAVVPAFGVHPWFADEWNAEAAKLLRRRLSDAPDAAAVGEIGLDRCRGNAPAQEKRCAPSPKRERSRPFCFTPTAARRNRRKFSRGSAARSPRRESRSRPSASSFPNPTRRSPPADSRKRERTHRFRAGTKRKKKSVPAGYPAGTPCYLIN